MNQKPTERWNWENSNYLAAYRNKIEELIRYERAAAAREAEERVLGELLKHFGQFSWGFYDPFKTICNYADSKGINLTSTNASQE